MGIMSNMFINISVSCQMAFHQLRRLRAHPTFCNGETKAPRSPYHRPLEIDIKFQSEFLETLKVPTVEKMSFAITSQALSLRFNKVSARPCRASRRSLAVRMQGAHAAAPPASGEIKDKNAELAINGTYSLSVSKQVLTPLTQDKVIQRHLVKRVSTGSSKYVHFIFSLYITISGQE